MAETLRTSGKLSIAVAASRVLGLVREVIFAHLFGVGAIADAYQVAYRIPHMQEQGAVPNYEASISKLYGAELTQRIAQTGVQLLGTAGQLAPHAEQVAAAPMGGGLSRNYLSAVAATIASGTSEVQRGVIARRGLGLPR